MILIYSNYKKRKDVIIMKKRLISFMLLITVISCVGFNTDYFKNLLTLISQAAKEVIYEETESYDEETSDSAVDRLEQELEKLDVRNFFEDESETESGSKTCTVWDNITPTQENYPYTNIPKSFEIEVNGEKMWVHGNATEHIYEYVYKGITTGNGTAYTNPNLYTQEIMSDFYGALQEATKSGIVYEEKITQGNWEFIFAQPRQAGQLPVIKHAQFNGWH
jgi:hypothetical protein